MFVHVLLVLGVLVGRHQRRQMGAQVVRDRTAGWLVRNPALRFGQEIAPASARNPDQGVRRKEPGAGIEPAAS